MLLFNISGISVYIYPMIKLTECEIDGEHPFTVYFNPKNICKISPASNMSKTFDGSYIATVDGNKTIVSQKPHEIEEIIRLK